MANMKPVRKSASISTNGAKSFASAGNQAVSHNRKAAGTPQNGVNAAKASYNRTSANVSPANHDINRSADDAYQPHGGKPSAANKKGVD